MRIRRACLLVALLALSLSTSAQTTAAPTQQDNEKAAKLDTLIHQGLDETIAGATSLRLPENRALVYAMLGDMYWRFDQKRSRELFRNAGAELAAYNADAERQPAEATTPIGYVDGMSLGGDPRYQVIPIIARRDAEMATQIMQQTRPQALADAMASSAAAGEQVGMGFGVPGLSAMRASLELNLEQQIATLAADQDPEAAVRLIKDSLSRGISYNVLPLLQKLAKSDEKRAAELGSSVVQKLLDADLAKNTDLFRSAINFLQFSQRVQTAATASQTTPGKQFNFTDVQQKDLAVKLAATVMAMPLSMSLNSWFAQVIPLLDKFAPEKSAAVKLRQAEMQKAMPVELRRNERQQNMFSANMTAEQLLAMLPKLNENERNAAYMALQNKIGSITDEAQAKKLVDQIPDEKVRASVEQQVNSVRVMRSLEAGKLDDARKQIAQMMDRRQQLQRYVSLALAYQKAGKESDLESAKAVLRDAKALTAAFPEDGEDLTDLMELIRGYTIVDPETAFKMAEPCIDMINEYVQAAAVLSKYNKDRNFRNGELVFKTNGPSNSLVSRYALQVQLLGKADLERTTQLIDRFSRADARMILRLYALQGASPAPRPATIP